MHADILVLVLVANDPTAYREVLASALAQVRPALRVRAVEPANLDPTAAQLRPRLVICSGLTAVVHDAATAAIVLYPNEHNVAVIISGGQHRLLHAPRFGDLLDAVDAVCGLMDQPER